MLSSLAKEHQQQQQLRKQELGISMANYILNTKKYYFNSFVKHCKTCKIN